MKVLGWMPIVRAAAAPARAHARFARVTGNGTRIDCRFRRSGRVGALGTFFVNAMAVISYSHVLLGEGFEAALGQHILWGTLTLGLIVFGPGSISVDWWLERRLAAHGRPLATNRADSVTARAASR